MVLDPATGRTLPDNAIQRVLFVTNDVHVYQIPPLTSNKGFTASTWTSPSNPTARQIFTCRLRVIETSVDNKISTVVALEDADTANLFAAAPYTSTAVVQPALDSSRFFAVRVQGEGGMKATLGIGFEDRSPAFDFGIALTESQKVLGLDGIANTPQRGSQLKPEEVKQDFSLKEGEKIHIQVGSKGRRQPASSSSSKPEDSTALFSIAPPPPAGKGGSESFATASPSAKSAQAFGFDDGEFGEFQ